MRVDDSWRKLASNDLAVLVLWATAGVLLHTVTNGQYGFHRDELATLDDARSLEWGYVAYPPLTPFLARVAFTLFGPSLIGLHSLRQILFPGKSVSDRSRGHATFFPSESAKPQMREAPGRALRRGIGSSDRSDAGEIAR